MEAQEADSIESVTGETNASEDHRATEENRFREIFDKANDLIYTLDLQGRITYANRAILRTMGYTSDEALGLAFASVVDPNYLPFVKSRMERRLKLGETTPPYEVLCRTKAGHPLWLEISASVILRQGDPVAILGIGHDVSQRKKAEESQKEFQRQVQEQKNLLEWMIEQNPFAIAFWNPNGSFHRCNEAFVKLLGIVPEPNYNLLRDAQLRKAGHLEAFRQAFKGNVIHIDRCFYDIAHSPNRNYPSKPLWAEMTLFPIIGEDGEILRVVSVYQDIQRQVEAESAKEALERQLIESQKLEAIGTLAGGVAHDFNNLLTGLMGYLDLIRSAGDKKIHPYVDRAEMVAQRASELTRQLLAYARKTRLEKSVHDLNNTAREVAGLIKQTMDRRIEIGVRLSPVPATVLADPGQMSQVVLNLCVNARDAVAERLAQSNGADLASWSPRITMQIKRQQITTEYCLLHPEAREGSFVRVSVSDSGVGMDEETQKRIFEPFFTTKEVGKGTGLGLATVFGIVKQHQGWVEVSSEMGKGTLFHVYLPAVEEPADVLDDTAANLKVRGGTETILVVDDEEPIRELSKEMLCKYGYRVLLAMDGANALEIYKRECKIIDLVILDMTMPRLSGRQILPELVRLKKDVKIIATSGYSFNDTWHDFPSSPAFCFLQKPYSSIELAQTVRRILDVPSAAGD